MGQKKKGGKSSKGGKGTGGVVDGVPMADMSREQLEKFTLRIKDELEREREERNFFQLERDKLRTFWEITRQQQDESKAEIRNKERELEEADEKHEAEIKAFNEKIKHLVYEHQCKLTEIKAENMVALKIAQEEYHKQEAILIQEKEELKKQIVEEQLSHEEELRTVLQKHGEELFGIRDEFMKKIEEMSIKAEKRLQKIKNYYETKNKMEITQIVENKNDVIHTLEGNHVKDLVEMKTYYKKITDNNLELISDMKEELVGLKSENGKMKNLIAKLKMENNTLVKPLEDAKERTRLLEKQLEDYKKNKSSLFEMHRRFSSLQKNFDEITTKKDVSEMEIEKLEFEKDEIKAHYSTFILNIQKKNALRVNVLEKKISVLESELERKEIQVAQLIHKTNVDPKTIIHAANKLQQAMIKREKRMEKLQIELGKLAKLHDEMIDDFLAKAKEFKIPPELLRYDYYQPVLRKIISEHMMDKMFKFSFQETIEDKDDEAQEEL
nr:growth arrest-specific protein 8 [Halyomorpha halys]